MDQSKDSIIKTSCQLSNLATDQQIVGLVVDTWLEQIILPHNNDKFIEFMYIANDMIQRSINKRNKDGKSHDFDIKFQSMLETAILYIF